jgi:hypothetical protein
METTYLSPQTLVQQNVVVFIVSGFEESLFHAVTDSKLSPLTSTNVSLLI